MSAISSFQTEKQNYRLASLAVPIFRSGEDSFD